MFVLARRCPVDPLVVREPQARQLLGGISRETLWRLRKAGLIQSVTIGRARLYPLDALRRFVRDECAKGSAAQNLDPASAL